MTKKSPSTNDHHHRYLKISVTDHVDPSDPNSTYINLSEELRHLFNGQKPESFNSVEDAHKMREQLTKLLVRLVLGESSCLSNSFHRK